jgi:hypothetical protein
LADDADPCSFLSFLTIILSLELSNPHLVKDNFEKCSIDNKFKSMYLKFEIAGFTQIGKVHRLKTPGYRYGYAILKFES